MNRTAAKLLLGVAVGTLSGCRRPPAPSRESTSACLEIDAPTAPVGFDAPFSITARVTCAGGRRGRIAWRQVAGVSLRALAIADDGFRLTGRTATLADARPGPLPWGVIPLSPRTRGEATLEALWNDGLGHELRREVPLAAAPRARGLPNTAIGARLYLGGEGWHLISGPPGSVATLQLPPGPANLLPDLSGDYRLADARGRELVLRAARYDETPLDCGRSGCHTAITDAAATSPMTTVLARGLGPAAGSSRSAFGPGYPGCALACHATGEPGLADGGYTQVASEMGVAADLPTRWEELPRSLRRLGGVGCLACHGPAALPPPAARAGVLRADVCAVCHDAPPRYGHVVAWRDTGMAHADRAPRTRSDRACARCHTTSGFLAAIGARAERPSPVQAEPIGITCAACHAVHAHETAGPPAALLRPPETAGPAALLRAPAAPTLLAAIIADPRSSVDARSSVCLPCHTPDPEAPLPSASAAALWLGRGGLDPASGQPLLGAAVHARAVGGCVACHRAGPEGLARGAGHGFAARPSTCTPCHAQPLPPSDLTARARHLWETWRQVTGAAPVESAPAHASDLRVDRGTPLGRAAWDVLLVIEDAGAAAHNAPYAQALLAAAEPVIARAATRIGAARK